NRWQSRSLWGAAAVLLVVASIATIRKLGNRESAQTQVTTTPTTQIENPSTVSVVFERYDVAAKDLAQNLEQRRAQMDPATTAVIDTCLQKIDSAIAEARTSLSESPNDATIAGLLTAAYEQKLDLLRRAEELPLRSL
ncbi:MAG: hypothetical protein ABJB66_17515, partial [Gemmatimonadaceae bacterium]